MTRSFHREIDIKAFVEAHTNQQRLRACLIHPYYDIGGLKNGIRVLTEAVRNQYGNLNKAEWFSDDYTQSVGYHLLSVVYTT